VAVIPKLGEVANRIEASRIHLMVIPLPSVRPWNVVAMIKSIRSCAQLCERANARLIYANGSRAAFYGGLAGHISRCPFIWHCRMTGRDIYLDPIITQMSNVIIANSRATAARFKGNSATKVRVVYNGIDLRWLKSDDIQPPRLVKEDWRVILVMARVSRWKRHDLALHAFERIAQVEPKAHLVCLGAKDHLDAGWWDQLQVMTSHSPFSERVHWIGQVEDIRPWLRSASLLLLTSDNEPFGRVLVEAMACGLPVVATRSGGVPEIVREGLDGMLVAPGSAHEISDHILKLFRDETLRNRISESGRKRAEEFSLETHVNRMVHVFEEALRYDAKRVGR
jgi:glycosyltransferase involved in cell wall biosynthesis